jgi:hypothetical protein
VNYLSGACCEALYHCFMHETRPHVACQGPADGQEEEILSYVVLFGYRVPAKTLADNEDKTCYSAVI